MEIITQPKTIMKSAVYLAACIILALSCSSQAAVVYQCENPHVIDGDTMQCGQVRVRLAGIDAPEMPGHCRHGRKCVEGNAEASRAALIALTRNAVSCRQVDTDRYGRSVALCTSAGIDLSCAMIAQGMAVPRYRPITCPADAGNP